MSVMFVAVSLLVAHGVESQILRITCPALVVAHATPNVSLSRSIVASMFNVLGRRLKMMEFF
jgi:hypothetical protein